MKSTPKGDPYLDFSALTRDQAGVLAEVTVLPAWDLFWPNFSQLRKDHHGVLISEPADGSQL